MNYRYGDKVLIKNLGVEGTIIEVRTRSIVVRFEHKGELVERHFVEDDLQRLPTTKERAIDHAIARARELRVRHAVVVVERSDGSVEQRLDAV